MGAQIVTVKAIGIDFEQGFFHSISGCVPLEQFYRLVGVIGQGHSDQHVITGLIALLAHLQAGTNAIGQHAGTGKGREQGYSL